MSGGTGPDLFDDGLTAKLADVLRELLDEYRRPHAHPWVIGWSGGKDSTVLVKLVREMLLDVPRDCQEPPRCKRFHEMVEALQADLNAWLVHHDRERPHLAYRKGR